MEAEGYQKKRTGELDELHKKMCDLRNIKNSEDTCGLALQQNTILGVLD